MFPFELVIELLVLVMLRYRILIFMVMTRLSHLIYLPKVPLILMVKCTFDLIVLKIFSLFCRHDVAALVSSKVYDLY